MKPPSVRDLACEGLHRLTPWCCRTTGAAPKTRTPLTPHLPPLHPALRHHRQDALAEWSKALAQGASPKGRGFEPHRRHMIHIRYTVSNTVSFAHPRRSLSLPAPPFLSLRLTPFPSLDTCPRLSRRSAIAPAQALALPRLSLGQVSRKRRQPREAKPSLFQTAISIYTQKVLTNFINWPEFRPSQRPPSRCKMTREWFCEWTENCATWCIRKDQLQQTLSWISTHHTPPQPLRHGWSHAQKK